MQIAAGQIADAERSVEEMRCRRDGDMQVRCSEPRPWAALCECVREALEVQVRLSAMWLEC